MASFHTPNDHQGPHRHRSWGFIVGYATIFIALALLGAYASGRLTGEVPLFLQRRHFQTDMGHVNLPRMTVSLSGSGDGGGGTASPRLRLDIVLEVSRKDEALLAGYQPRMSERINDYILRLQPEEVRQKNAATWLRRELLLQVNSVGAPAPVHDLFFQQFVLM